MDVEIWVERGPIKVRDDVSNGLDRPGQPKVQVIPDGKSRKIGVSTGNYFH
jgi:hypothetical protein